MSTRRNHAPEFKAKVAMAALRGNKTLAELSSEFGVHQAMIAKWHRQLKDDAARRYIATSLKHEVCQRKRHGTQ